MPSANATAALLAQETSEVFLVLFSFDEAGDILPAPLRFVRNTEDITSNSDLYTAIACELRLAPDTGQSLGQVQLSVDNVAQTLVDEIRTYPELGWVTVRIVTASTPNTVEWGPAYYRVLGASWDADRVEFRLGFEDLLSDKFPRDRFEPSRFPAMFR